MRDAPDSPPDGPPLKTPWFHILLALADRDRHGYGIMKEVEVCSAGKVRMWPATLYGTIKQLVDAGLISECEERPRPDRDDPRRRYYSLTALGRRALSTETERLSDLLGVARRKQLAGPGGPRP